MTLSDLHGKYFEIVTTNTLFIQVSTDHHACVNECKYMSKYIFPEICTIFVDLPNMLLFILGVDLKSDQILEMNDINVDR